MIVSTSQATSASAQLAQTANTISLSPVETTVARAFSAQQRTTARLSEDGLHGAHSPTNTDEMARLGVNAIFRQRTVAVTQQVLREVVRRDRVVLLLQDGRRSLKDVARLLHRNEVEIAQVMVRLLQQGYVEFVGIRKS